MITESFSNRTEMIARIRELRQVNQIVRGSWRNEDESIRLRICMTGLNLEWEVISLNER